MHYNETALVYQELSDAFHDPHVMELRDVIQRVMLNPDLSMRERNRIIGVFAESVGIDPDQLRLLRHAMVTEQTTASQARRKRRLGRRSLLN